MSRWKDVFKPADLVDSIGYLRPEEKTLQDE